MAFVCIDLRHNGVRITRQRQPIKPNRREGFMGRNIEDWRMLCIHYITLQIRKQWLFRCNFESDTSLAIRPVVVGVWSCLTVNACCHAVPPWHEGSESNVVPAAQPDLQAILSEIRGLIAASVP